MMSHGLFLLRLKGIIQSEYGGNQGKAADAWGISRGLLNEVLSGIRRPAPKLLNAIGWERVILYAPKEEAANV